MEAKVKEIAETPVLSAKGISKSFGATKALSHVNFDLMAGEIHGLIGENGAGKSTLIKILAGDYFPDQGEILFKGRRVQLRSPAESLDLGIRVIYQEFNLVSSLTVAENICLGDYPASRIPGVIQWKSINRKAREVLEQIGEKLPVERLVKDLSTAEQQIVEIAKALSEQPKVLIMDEPTAALSDNERANLFKMLRVLKARGVSIIYITHHISEQFELADRVTVLRDGMTVDTVDPRAISSESLVRMMVGRELKDMYPRRPIAKGEPVFEVRGLWAGNKLHDIHFKVRRGEIVAIYGLLGAGQNELSLALFGEIPIKKGDVFLEGTPLKLSSPGDACKTGIGLISDDRRRDGLIPVMNIKENISLVSLRRYARFGVVQSRVEEREANHWVQRLNIRCSTLKQQVRFLSGGNQQKAVIARWLANRSKVLILNLPTRGVDVGAKVEIYKLLEDLCEQGVGIIIISLEMPEVLGIADKILVMHKDTIVAEVAREEASQDELLRYAMGLSH